MKNQPFYKRIGYSYCGFYSAWRLERSFRTQLFFAAGVLSLLVVLRPKPMWWALLVMSIAMVLGAELFNTALEQALDHLHPDLHPSIKIAKDCAAGAVLVMSVCAVSVFVAFLFSCCKF